MFNRLHSIFFRPEKGWDPVSIRHAESYSKYEWENFNAAVVDDLEREIGTFKGKTVLDLGGGPGQYSIEFSKRGAKVVWHDISRNYMKFAQDRAKELHLAIDFSIGYLEDSRKFCTDPFDFVFNRICWNYCMNDASFARLFYTLVKPGGAGYIDCTNLSFDPGGGMKRIFYGLNNHLGWKVGHPYPPRGRIARLFQAFPLEYMILDYRTPTNDKVLFVKPKGPI